MRYPVIASLVLTLILGLAQIQDAIAGEGSFSLQVPLGDKMQNVEGTLLDAQLDSANNATARMNIDTRLPVGFTSIFVTATGEWIGTRQDRGLEGSLKGSGDIDAGALGRARLQISGFWQGLIGYEGSASGNLSAKITVLESSIFQAPAGEQINVTAGSWHAVFDLPATVQASETSSLIATSPVTTTQVESPASTPQAPSHPLDFSRQLPELALAAAAVAVGFAYYFRRKRS